jgi:hypothetical protein
MQRGLGLLLVLIPPIVSAAFVVADSMEHAHPQPAPKTLEAPQSPPVPERDDTQSQVPQRPSGEVIGVPMLA